MAPCCCCARSIDTRGLSRAAAAAIPEPRDPERIRHGLRELLAQRLSGLCCGYEDLNDHKTLLDDVLMQTAVGRDEALALAPRSAAWTTTTITATCRCTCSVRPGDAGVPLEARQDRRRQTGCCANQAACHTIAPGLAEHALHRAR
jgi:hypothetical protein